MTTHRSGGREVVRSAEVGGVRLGPEGSGADIEVKKTAKIDALAPEILRALPKIVEAWRAEGAPTPVITSGNDGRHMKGSLHYANRAIDLRGNNIPDRRGRAISQALQASLGADYFVQFESFPRNPANDHIHLEYDPKAKPAPSPPRR